MKPVIKMVLTLSIFTASTLAFADHQIGNGGDAVVCRAPSGEITIQLLDFYERDALRPEIDQQLGEPMLSVAEKIALALDRLRALDPERADGYQEAADHFFEHVQWSSEPLQDVRDEALTIQPRCPLEQAVIQQDPKTPSDGRYVINRELFAHMNNDQKAGLILHEIVYRDAIINRSEENSFTSRYFNTLITSSRFASMTESEYQDLLRSMAMDQTLWRHPATGETWRLFLTRYSRYSDAAQFCRTSGWEPARFTRLLEMLSDFEHSAIAAVLRQQQTLVPFWTDGRDSQLNESLVGYFEPGSPAFKFAISARSAAIVCYHE